MNNCCQRPEGGGSECACVYVGMCVCMRCICVCMCGREGGIFGGGSGVGVVLNLFLLMSY